MKGIDYLKGRASMLVNVLYHRPSNETDWIDYLDIIYKDLDGNKQLLTIKEPTIDIFFAKEEYIENGYNRAYLELEHTEKHEVKFKDLPFEIANIAGPKYQEYCRSLVQSRNRYGLKNMHKYKNVFGSDYPIDNFYRIWWLLEVEDPKYAHMQSPTKGYLDIEVDGIDFPGFVTEGKAPINAVTIIDDSGENAVSYTFLLRNSKNPQIQEFENDLADFIQDLHESFDEVYGEIDYQFFMYDENDEVSLIRDLFVLINSLQLDFIMIWNMSFDIPYIIDRIVVLGRDPRDIMCDPTFPVKECYFVKDKRNFKVGEKTDYTFISSKSSFIDQMILYAAVRKSQSEISSYKLTDVGKHEVGDEKLDYSEMEDFKTFPYQNYKKFVKYNIKDVLLQIGIERKVRDVDNLYKRSYQNATNYAKSFKQTVFLSNRAYIEYYNQGLIIGNNINVNYDSTNDKVKIASKGEEEEEGYAGGLVANPVLNNHVGVELMGSKSMFIFKFVVDMDFSSMYPNIIIAFNIAPNTMIGKIIITLKGEDAHEFYSELVGAEDLDKLAEVKDIGAEFLDDLQVGDIFTIATKWFGLPDIDMIIDLAKEKFNKTGNKKKRTILRSEDVRYNFVTAKPVVEILEEECETL